MNLRKKKILLFNSIALFIICFICFSSMKEPSNVKELPEADKIALNIIEQTISSLSSKHNIHGIGYGMKGKFQGLDISFEVLRPLTKEQARIIILDCAEIFLGNINSNEKIKPYLKDLPFTLKNIGVTLFIKDTNSGDIFYPNICIAACTSRGVYFRTTDPQTDRFKETYEETHEEALALVKGQLH